MTFKIGICGSHRTGKTTLAKNISQTLKIPFIPTQTNNVFAQHGLHPAQPLNFKTRLWIQQQVLASAIELWQTQTDTYVTDRTPIDFIAYTLADIQGNTVDEFTQLENYLSDCFQATDEFFTQLIVIQPAIPLIQAPGKAALNRSYMEHLNILIQGLCHDERLHCPAYVIRRDIIDIQARIDTILS
jgi:hypothetical protein